MDPDPQAGQDPEWSTEPSTLAALAAAVDQACRQLTAFFEFDKPFGDLHPAGVTEAMSSWAGIAFYYRLRTSPDRPGAHLEPRHGNEIHPPATDNVAAEPLALWAALASACSHPLAAARYNDLAFVTRTGNGRTHADAAAAGYLDASSLQLEDGERDHCALRAWTVARDVHNADAESAAATRLRELVDHALAQTHTRPSVIDLLDALTSRTRAGPAPLAGDVADELLAAVRRRLLRTHLISDLARIRRRVAAGDKDAVAQINLDEAQAYLADALRRDGAVRAMLLNETAQVARRLNVPDIHDEAVRQMQAVDTDTFDWQTDPATLDVPRWMHLFDVLRYTRRRRWQDILAAWCASPAPSGIHEHNRRETEDDDGSGFMSLFPTTHFAQGMPQRTTTGDDQQQRLIERESISAQLQADVLAEVLDTVARRSGPATDDALHAELLQLWGADPTLTRRYARTLGRYLRGDLEGAAYLAYPLVEAGARSFLLAADVPLYQVQFSENNGRFAGLGAMLEPLADEGISQDWIRFLRLLFVAEGLNLRNQMAHGAMDEVDRRTAVLLLRAAALMVSVSAPAGLTADARSTPRSRTFSRRLAAATRAFLHELHLGRPTC